MLGLVSVSLATGFPGPGRRTARAHALRAAGWSLCLCLSALLFACEPSPGEEERGRPGKPAAGPLPPALVPHAPGHDPELPLGLIEALQDRLEWQRLFAPADQTMADAWGRTIWAGYRVPGFTYERTRSFAAGGQSHWIVIVRHERTGLEFAVLPGGTFKLGSPEEEEERRGDEGPQRAVEIRPFLLCTTEATQAAWERVMGSNPSHWRGAELPVEQVSWEEAREWCRKAGLRLPTEAEWEYACRAGTTTRYFFGDDPEGLDAHAWSRANSQGRPHPVASKRPNAFGLFDLAGNVWEWCEDGYRGSYQESPTDGRPVSGDPLFRVDRGGSWGNAPDRLRSAARGWVRHDYRGRNLGFRPAAP